MARIRRASKRMRVAIEKENPQPKEVKTLDLMWDIKYPRGEAAYLGNGDDITISINRKDIDNYEHYNYMQKIKRYRF